MCVIVATTQATTPHSSLLKLHSTYTWNRWHSRLLIADEGYSQKGLLVVITAGLMVLRPGDTDLDSSEPFFLQKA
jgi:hypothetical protein